MAWRLVTLAIVSLTWAATATQAAEQPGRWALLIGVDDYLWARKLEYCGADMRALGERLASSGFAKDHIYLLHDKAEETKYRPTKVNIEAHLRLVLSLAERNDVVVVGFSGHGLHIDAKSYLCPSEARLEDPKSLVPVDVVYDLLQKSPASLKLLLVDACRNDPRLAGERSLTPGDDAKRFAQSLEEPPQGILLLSSCAPGEVAREEKEFGHGVFMNFLLEGLSGKADANRNGRVSLMEMYLYTNDKTKTYVARKFVESQRPSLKGEIHDDFDIAVVRPEKVEPNRKQVKALFTVREGDEKGPVLPGATVELKWREKKGADPVVLGRAASNTEGNAQMDVLLNEEQQKAGEILVTAALGGSSETWPLSGFPRTSEWNLFLPALRPPLTANGWQEFRSEDAQISAQFPGKPEAKTVVQGDTRVVLAFLEVPGGGYIVMASRGPASTSGDMGDLEQRFTTIRITMTNQLQSQLPNATLISEARTSLEDIPGREWLFGVSNNGKHGRAWCRAYVSKDGVCGIMFVAEDDRLLASGNREKFLNSLRLAGAKADPGR